MQNEPQQPWREITFWAIWMVGSSIGAWLLPTQYHFQAVIGLLTIGVFFDIVSLFYHVMTMVTGQYMSGFPGVSLFFYAWFLLASKFSLVALHETSLVKILLFKLVDALVLVIFSCLCQLPERFQSSRDKYR